MRAHIIQAIVWISIIVMIAGIALVAVLTGMWRDDRVMGALLNFAIISVFSGVLVVRALRGAFACRRGVMTN